MEPLDLPDGWQLTLDAFEERGEFAAENRSNLKIHCNRHQGKFKILAIHLINGLLEDIVVDNKEDVPSRLNEFTHHIESEYA